ncbi:MAG: DUF6057 family protein [Bacteroidaceae bacterium]|nr:DUF6057 family protein [Bacteroidaceae bacterium]
MKKYLNILFFLLAWLWASWWMGDVLRIAYERSFFAPDATLMHWLWQQSFGTLWILGRALLTLYRWPLLGGLLVALLLTTGSWLVGYCLRLPVRWRWAQYLPAGAWMLWTAWSGLDLYYQHEPGRILGIPLLVALVCAIDAFIIWTFKHKKRALTPAPAGTSTKGDKPSKEKSPLLNKLWKGAALPLFFLILFAAPIFLLQQRHPYLRPLTHMQVQLLQGDYEGMSATAHKHAALSYRPLAAYYAIALTRTGHLADQLFDIRFEFDSLHVHEYDGRPDDANNYFLVDCDYHAGLIRPALHRAMEELTMDGPSLFTLKHLTKMALIEHEWTLARKYLHILHQAPFESQFISKYEAMLDRPELVAADVEFESVLRTAPVADAFEGQFEKPCFLGYHAVANSGRTMDALTMGIMVNLYSKRMPDFLARCEVLVGSTPPRYIAEGLVTQTHKNPVILEAFPQLKMEVQRFRGFLQVAQPYMQQREQGGDALFEDYIGYFPYYYFFGNLRATRKTNEVQNHSSAGVN